MAADSVIEFSKKIIKGQFWLYIIRVVLPSVVGLGFSNMAAYSALEFNKKIQLAYN